MLHMRLCQSLNLQFAAVTLQVFHTVVFLTLMHSCRAQPHVIGPSHPVVATLGDDIILPCHLDPAMNALKLTVEWRRLDLDPRFVLVLRHNVELDNKHPAYEGRTSLFSDELKLGNISLKLSRVRTSDEGGYRCFVPELNRDAAVQLVVGAASRFVIQMTKNSSSIDLHCESTGWYPEPEVFWLDGEGNLLSAGPPETVRGPDDLYTVSSRVTVEKRHSNSFTCRVTQKKTNQTRETQIQVPDDFFIVPPGSSPTSSVPAIVGAVLGIMFILAVAAGCFLWKWRRNKIQNKERSLEDGAELTKEEQTEGEEESLPLMSGREENDVNNESQSEKEKLKFVAQRETQRDQLMITSELITDMGGAGAEGDNERVSLIQTERETHQQQEMMRRREQNDCVKEERQEKKKPDKEDSEPPTVSISEGQREQPHNLQTDQEEKKEEETEEEKITEEKQPRREEDETEETSETETEQKDNEQQREGKLDFRQKRKEKVEEQRREQKKQQQERGRRIREHLQKQEESKLEPEDKKDKDQEGNQNGRTREEESENGKEEINEKSKEKESVEREIEPPSQRPNEVQMVEEKNELQTQKENVEHEVSESSKQTAEHEEKEENNSEFTGETERKADGKNGQSNEKLKKTDVKNLERSREPQLETQEEPERVERMKLPTQKKTDNQEVFDGSKQETEHEYKRSEGQEEKLQESSKDRKKNQSKDTRMTERSAEVVEVERSAEVVEVEGKGGQEERADGGADREETKETSEEIEKHRQKKSDNKEETGEQLQESSTDLRLRGAESLDGVKEEETNGRGFTHVTQRKGDKRVKRKQKKDEVCHDHQQQTVGKRKPEKEDTVQTEEDVKKTRQDTPMEVDEAAAAAAHTEQEVKSDSEVMECDSEPYHGSVCQEDQQDEQMQL